jgi:hypothetical protein
MSSTLFTVVVNALISSFTVALIRSELFTILKQNIKFGNSDLLFFTIMILIVFDFTRLSLVATIFWLYIVTKKIRKMNKVNEENENKDELNDENKDEDKN